MAIGVNVYGAALARIGTGGSGALEDLGYSVNGIEIEENVFTSNVPGDQNGGDEGPPIDIQYFGRIDIVRLDMSKWDAAVVDKVQSRLNGVAGGVIGVAGSLMAGANLGYRLLVLPVSGPRNYLFAVPRNPFRHNRGTKFARMFMEFECHAVSGVLWNTTTT